jgi:hypothetical protein
MTTAANTGMAPIRPTALPLRLSLRPRGRGSRVLDGGWWPHSHRPEAELPGLVIALAGRGSVTRIALNPGAWESAPASIVVDSRTVQVDWVPTQDQQLVVLTVPPDETIELLVVPPRTSMTHAASALAAASDPANSRTASQIVQSTSPSGVDPG